MVALSRLIMNSLGSIISEITFFYFWLLEIMPKNDPLNQLDLLERALKRPIKVPVHEVTGMKKPEDNYGAFISMTPGQPY